MARRREGIEFHWQPSLYEVEQDVLGLAENLDKGTLVLAASRRIVQDDIQERFDYIKGDPEGDLWAPWGEEYAKYAENRNLNGILVQDSDLRDAAIADGPFTISGDFLLYDTSMLPEYAAAHQFGLATGGKWEGTLPKREFLGISPHAEAAIAGTYLGFIENAIAVFYSSAGKIQTQTRGRGGRFGPKPTF